LPMNPQVFREYDIRGIVEGDFDDDFIVNLGRGYVTLLPEAGKKTITLGRVCRLSSDALRDLLIEACFQAESTWSMSAWCLSHCSISRFYTRIWTAAR
jgi:phosphomannomutase